MNDDPGPGPPEPRLDPARAGSPATHAVPLNSRGVSCTPIVGVKGNNGVVPIYRWAPGGPQPQALTGGPP